MQHLACSICNESLQNMAVGTRGGHTLSLRRNPIGFPCRPGGSPFEKIGTSAVASKYHLDGRGSRPRHGVLEWQPRVGRARVGCQVTHTEG